MRVLLAAAVTALVAVPAAAQPTIQSEKQPFRVTQVVRGLEHPWALAFLPDGGMLVTERPGRLRIVRAGALDPRPVAKVPAVFHSGQGGLLDVALHPDFARNRLLYLSYAARAQDGAATRVARARLTDAGLADVQIVFEALPRGTGGLHFGSRLAFGRDGTLYVTTGERNDRHRAQQLDDLAGKVVRLRDDGSVPPDNPFVGRAGARPEIFSYGHRNPQGLAIHPSSGAPWLVEHGPRGGDELNLVRAGLNYGWPVVTHGTEYHFLPIGEGKSKPGLEDGLRVWVPSISPSGLAFYTGDALPGWRGSLFLGALSGEMLVRLELDGARVTREERLLQRAVGRVRDVRQGPDGRLYLLTDSGDGALLRLDPG